MRYLIILLLTIGCCAQKTVVTSDIPNFWNAYDAITRTSDTTEQARLLRTLYLEKGSAGLQGMIQARRYTEKEFLHAIIHYPEFWKSIKANTLKSDEYAARLEAAIGKLKVIYPKLKPATIYFTVGALRSGGTTIADRVLIGSEISMTNKKTVTSELDTEFPHLRAHFDTEPINNLDFLNVHEYIHTQQNTTIGNTLLSQAIIEGAAEFIAEKALDVSSPNPQITYGKTIENKLKAAFLKEMFTLNLRNWFWNSPDNAFGMRDLGYFIGYAICNSYYDRSADRSKSVAEMIRLDYNDQNALYNFVDKSGYFDKKVAQLQAEFNRLRPKVTGIAQFKNGSKDIHPSLKHITLIFSKPMNINYRGFDYGPLGEDKVLRVQKIVGFSEDRKSFTFEIEIQPGKRYQSVATERFVDENGYALEPYLIDFTTEK